MASSYGSSRSRVRDCASDSLRPGDACVAGVLRRRPWMGVIALEVEQAALGAAPGLAVRGQMDLATVPALEERLNAAIPESVGAFVLDLSNVEFLDSTGASHRM